MAATLAEEVRRKQIEALLTSAGDAGDEDQTDTDASDAKVGDEKDDSEPTEEESVPYEKTDTSEPEAKTDSAKIPGFDDWTKWPTVSPPKALEPVTAESVIAPSPTPTPSPTPEFKYPTIAEDQPAGLDQANRAIVPSPSGDVPAGHIDLAPPNVKTDPDTGTRYVIDSATGKMVPYAELATEADKQAQQPSDVQLQQVDVTGTVPVKRATLVKLPAGFKYPTIAEDQGAPGTPPAVQRAQPVVYPTVAEDQGAPPAQPAAQPVAQPVTGELAQGPPGTHPAGTQDEPYWPKRPEQISQLPPGSVYIDPTDGSVKTSPGTPSKEPPRPAQTKEVPSSVGVDQKPTAAPPTAADLNINTDYQAQPNSYSPGRGKNQIQGIVLHSSDGRESGDLNTLTTGGVSAHYYVTKDGRIYNLVPEGDTAYHAGKTVGPYNNSNTIGIEQEHYDPGGKGGESGEAWSQPQVESTARLVAYLKSKYGLSDQNIVGHSDVAPERKQDPYNYPWQHFFSYVDRASGGAPSDRAPAKQDWESWATTDQPAGPAPKAVSATGDQITIGTQKGFYPDENPAKWAQGRMTMFGDDSDVAKFQAAKAQGLTDKEALQIGDNGVGSPSLGKLNTNNPVLMGAAIPISVLQNTFGNSPAKWREARVDVVDLNTGQRMRLPIVDVGLSHPAQKDVAVDLTQAAQQAFGGDTGHKFAVNIVPNAGADVTKNPDDFWNEQAAIRKVGDIGAPSRQAAQKPAADSWQTWATLSPAEQVSADTAMQYQQRGQIDTLDELNRTTENPGQLWKILNQPIEGVSDTNRKAYQENFKQELTKYAQNFYGEPDADKAFQRAVGDANIGTFGQDVGRSFMGTLGQVDVGLNKASKDIDYNRLDQFAKVIHPESAGPGRAAFIKTITDIKDPTVRAQTIGKIIADLEPAKQAALNSVDIADSADRVASPEYQAAQNNAIATKDAWVKKQFEPDPALKGTAGQFWSGQSGALLANTALAFLPKAIQTSAFAAQIYGTTRDRVKDEHPDWTDELVGTEAAKSTLAQLAPQELVIAASHGILAPLIQWAANPVARFGIGGGIHLAIGAAGGALQQGAANIAEGKPTWEGVPESALGGAIQAVPFAIHGGVHAAITPREAPVMGEPVTPAPEMGPKGGEIKGAELPPPGEEARPPVPPPPIEEGPPVPPPPPGEEERPPVPKDESSGLKMVVKDRYGNVIGETEARQGRSSARVTVGEMLNAGGDSAVRAQEALNNGWSREDPMPKPGEKPPPVTPQEGNLPTAPPPATELTPQQFPTPEASTGQPPLPDVASEPVPAPSVTKEDVTQASPQAQSLPQDLAGAIRQQREDAARAQAAATLQTPSAAAPHVGQAPPPVSASQPHISAIRNESVRERVAAGELGTIQPGTGLSREELVAKGMKMGPEEINRLSNNFLNNTGGDPVAQASAIRAEEARLSQASRQASLASESDPENEQLRTQADAAFKAATDWHNKYVAKLKSDWANQGRAMQGEIPVDLSTLNGLRDVYEKTSGKPAPAGADPILRRTAKRVRTADLELSESAKRASAVIEKEAARRPLPTADQVRENGMRRLKDYPCPT